MLSSIREMQKIVMDPTKRTSTLVTRGLEVAEAFGDTTAAKWMSLEVNGYGPCGLAELPTSRTVTGILSYLHPYRGWLPVRRTPQTKAYERVIVREPLWLLEERLVDVGKHKLLSLWLSCLDEDVVKKSLRLPYLLAIRVSIGQIHQITDLARLRVMGWALELPRRCLSTADAAMRRLAVANQQRTSRDPSLALSHIEQLGARMVAQLDLMELSVSQQNELIFHLDMLSDDLVAIFLEHKRLAGALSAIRDVISLSPSNCINEFFICQITSALLWLEEIWPPKERGGFNYVSHVEQGRKGGRGGGGRHKRSVIT